MSDQATVSVIDSFYVELMGRAAMDLRPRLKTFPVIEGGWRMLAERRPGAATLVSIQGGKEPK
jgi:hypothetical protein